MIRTPSLRNRLTITTVGMVALVVLVLDTFVYLSLAERLDETLEQVLAARTQVAVRVAEAVGSTDGLVEALNEADVEAVVRFPDGRAERTEPGQVLFDELPPSTAAAMSMQDVSTVVVDDGGEIDVLVSRGGVEATMRRVLVLETIGSVVAILLTLLVMQRAARVVTRPVDTIVDVADRIADGRTDLRLDPSDPTTEVGRMAAALDRVVEALDRALATARREEQRSRTFLGDAAHQLRTPVAGLRATAETLLTAPDTGDRDALLQSVARETDRIGRLVDALLSMARLDGEQPIPSTTVDLASLLRTEVDHQASLSPDLVVALELPSRVHDVRGDVTWLRAAVGNLLDNARRHARRRIVVAVVSEPDAVVVTVTDDGPGVPVGDRERVFERFVSLDGDGSGLGLPIARGVAEALGGSLDLVQDRFVLRLPTPESLARSVEVDRAADPGPTPGD